ncbi:MAG: ABC transporter permease [Oscillospiraceae bacterium]|nr:ABC transporter permease [Oscillospiraceae bacterium]
MICTCILPLVFLFVRPFWTDGNMNGISFIMLFLMSGAYLMSLSILTDKADGAVIRILAAPITTRRYLIENLLACMVPLVAQTALISLLGMALHGWSLALSFALFLCYTVLILASVAMAFTWHCIFKRKESSATGFSLLLFLTAFLGGATFPVEAFPGILQYIGAIFPAYWAIRGLESFIENGAMTATYWLSIGALLLFTAAFLLYGGKRRIV